MYTFYMAVQTDERLFTPAEVADRLGVSVNRVQAMVRAGQLQSVPVNSRIRLIPLRSMLHARAYIGHSGRPYAERTSIAVLYTLSGSHINWLTKQQNYRMRRQLAGTDVDTLIRNLRNRGIVREYQASDKVVAAVRNSIQESASSPDIRQQLQLMATDMAEGYITPEGLRSIERQYRLNNDLKPTKIRFHVSQYINQQNGTSLTAFAAIDLAESTDIRERIAGRNALAELLSAYQKETNYE
ncbi:helix-turn-helix domain-containing protein [Bifidobacterium simiiventris]|uniref:helix-turn-helix domain-containing protein n=1 Tax=Bifidobacterium simiiventris TaxID=2834434 RepID=UPI001C59A05D|nr:helix-turn-helix domain-containing protein [Bifidobacterium simiiventris]MBW3079671.1 helix-turn-helix domain-containing protein [Bifidobacterium simiiventris]